MIGKLTNYLVLYASHGLKLFSFIILIPHFTEVFSKSVWGKILIVQAISIWLQTLVEFGFNLSATRKLTQSIAQGKKINVEISGIFGAKIILSLLVFPIALVLSAVIPSIRGDASLIMCGAVLAITQGMLPSWYFLAINKYYWYSIIDAFSRVIYIFCCFLFINSNQDILLVFMIPIATSLITFIWGSWIIYKDVGFLMPSVTSSVSAIKTGGQIFLFTSLTSIYTTLNLVILGIYQTTSQVAIYGTADRIVRASGGLLEPLNRIVFAKISGLYASDQARAIKFLKTSSLAVIVLGFLLFGLLNFASDDILSILASNYSQSADFIKLLAFYIPVLAVNNILGLYIMIPMNMDREFNYCFMGSSLVSLVLMIILLPKYGSFGLAVITIVTEILSSILMAYFILRRLKEKGVMSAKPG